MALGARQRRLPVVVGAGQLTRRPDDPATAAEPLDMMADVLRAAQDDSCARRSLLEAAESIRVVDLLSWRYADPGALLGQRLGASPRETVRTTVGGNSPQMLVNDTALAIQRGDLDIALVAGAEAVYTRRRARQAGVWLPWTPLADSGDDGAPRVLGDARPGTNDVEMAHSAAIPTQIYPLFENALRAAAGESIDEHQIKVSTLWARFSEVAAANPHAWSPVARTAEEIRAVTADNRMVGFPYTKYMNANLDTDQAAGLVVCSAEAAEAFGVPRERWVFIHSGADAHDHWWVSSRADLHSSPAIRLCGQAAGAADVDHVDLYSCFPCAVQIGAAELGLSTDRELTVTGGLAFAGGPGNNYSTHAIAAMVGVLRADPGSRGLVTALGWYVTKHAMAVYSTDPPAAGYRWSHPQADVDALPRRELAEDVGSAATIESYTVMHDRDGSPALGIVACLRPDGRRAWANVHDPDVLTAMTTEEFVGCPAPE